MEKYVFNLSFAAAGVGGYASIYIKSTRSRRAYLLPNKTISANIAVLCGVSRQQISTQHSTQTTLSTTIILSHRPNVLRVFVCLFPHVDHILCLTKTHVLFLFSFFFAPSFSRIRRKYFLLSHRMTYADTIFMFIQC